MKKLLVFGGTTEGRELSGWCAENAVHADVSVTTDYGARLLGAGEYINVFTGRLDKDEMVRLINTGNYFAAVDATHPYAEEATRNISSACTKTGLPYYRLIRAECETSGTCVGSLGELVGLLNETDDIVLSTLGSKEIPALKDINECRRRVWLRVLPAEGIEERCENSGFDRAHIIVGKGPFSLEENILHIRQSGAKILVTKECGAAGGYPEKLAAAKECGIKTVTVTRPKESGYTFDELTAAIKRLL